MGIGKVFMLYISVNERFNKPSVHRKVLKKDNLTTQNKQQVVLFPKRITTSWSAIHKLARKKEFKQSVVDQLQQN